MNKSRTFTRKFKLEVVRQLDSGERRITQICREQQLDDRMVRRWRQEVASRGVAAFTSEPASAVETFQRRIAELERVCGQLAIENAILKRGEQLAAWRSGQR